MYKTVRHGENSLQYTILPQTEEVLNNSGLKGKGRDYSPSIHVRRSRRKSTVKYVLLVLFGVVIALALAAVPLYVMNGALYARRNLENGHRSDIIINSPTPLTPTVRQIAKAPVVQQAHTASDIILTVKTKKPKVELSSTTTSSTKTTAASTPVTSDRATTPPWTMPALRSWKSSTSSTTIPPIPTEDNEKIPLIGTPSGSIRLLDHYMSAKPWEDTIIRATVTPEPFTIRNIFRYYSRSYVPTGKPVTANPKVFEDVLITTKATTARTTIAAEPSTSSERSKLKDLKDTLLSVDDDDEFKESLEVDEVFSLPPLKPESGPGSDSDEVTVSKAGEGGWYGARWPFVDTSSYFQWTVSTAAMLSDLCSLQFFTKVGRYYSYITASLRDRYYFYYSSLYHFVYKTCCFIMELSLGVGTPVL